MSVANYLSALLAQKAQLATNLTSKGVSASAEETLNTLVPKVLNISNSYSLSDEGKVVSGGALVSQSSMSVSQNGSYNTTLYDSVVVNIAELPSAQGVSF